MCILFHYVDMMLIELINYVHKLSNRVNLSINRRQLYLLLSKLKVDGFESV